MKGGYSFRKFTCNRELIPYCWRCYIESSFANIELSFRGKRCLETNDQRVLEISDKCSRLTEHVGCLVK